MNLKKYLSFFRGAKGNIKIELFFDIETYTYNIEEALKHPSDFKNQVFSLAISYWYKDEIYVSHFNNFIDFFNYIENEKLPVNFTINLIGHNINKYDNHYLLYQILKGFNPDRYPKYLLKARNNDETETFKTLKKHKGDRILLEKRVKSKTNLELDFTLGTVTYKTVDGILKTGMRSLKSIGKTMNKMGILDSKYLKTDFDYKKYNLKQNINYLESLNYARKIWLNLSKEEFRYIDNDVIILGYYWKYYTKVFNNFDKSKITFSQNILEEYKTTPLSTFQLTGKYSSLNINYSDYDFRNMNFADYLKYYYNGGLNLYNDKYLGTFIKDVVSFDLNSSYPNVMYNFKIPTYLIKANDEHNIIKMPKLTSEYFYMFEIDIDTFNNLIDNLKSKMLKKALVKYYTKLSEHVYINSNTIKIIEQFSRSKICQLEVYSYLKWKCEYFDARNVISDNYFLKTQGKNKNKIEYINPSNIKVIKEINPYQYTPEEISTSKVILNGIYGLPALRPYYNLFKYSPENDEIESFPNGFANTERNMIFSVFVTSQAFFNLLQPLKYLTSNEIDKYFYYADTDSLYISRKVLSKIDKSLLNELNLGYWKNEHNIDEMYILNHKKYAFLDTKGKPVTINEDEPDEYTTPINIRSGGVNQDNFNFKMDFHTFIKTQFSHGVSVKATRAILTKIGTIAIYDSKIKLELGQGYLEHIEPVAIEILEKIKEKAKIELLNSDDKDGLYIETPFGILSVSDVMNEPRKINNRDIKNLIELFSSVYDMINSD